MKKLHHSTSIAGLFIGLLTSASLLACPAHQAGFNTPEEAAQALQNAASADDRKQLGNLFGKEFLQQVASGDKVADTLGLQRLATLMKEKQSFVKMGDNTAVLQIGSQGWPFPAPLVSSDGRWHFDSKRGAEELINRRIGENELRAIGLCEFYVEAQRLYQTKDRDGDGAREYAQRIISTPGRKNGLYWNPNVSPTSTEPSPFSPVIEVAIEEGYDPQEGEPLSSIYRGYHYQVLNAAGPHAAGGAKSYIGYGGMMTEGFALITYPARWGVSGIMTFMVSNEGVVYQKDLGPNTEKLAAAIKAFDPDSSWQRVGE